MVIFNPWNSGENPSYTCSVTLKLILTDDDSFVESSEEINDYVLNCQGVIWRGNYRQKLAMYWDYGQVGSKKIEHVLKI